MIDVVGLSLAPPEKSIVLCLYDKSSVQALDRTQPSLPMKKGRAQTMTSDYKRKGAHLGGRESVGEGDRERVQCWLPPHGPS